MNEQVFISYSSKDDLIANVICDELDRYGITYFRDKSDKSGIDAAKYFVEELSKEIPTVRALLLIVTGSSMNSAWVKWEIICARAEGKKIFPLAYGYSPSPKDCGLIGESQFKNKKDTLIRGLAEWLAVPDAQDAPGIMNTAYGGYAARRGGKTVVSSDKKLFLIEGNSAPRQLEGAPACGGGLAFINDYEIVYAGVDSSAAMSRFNLNTLKAAKLPAAGRMIQASVYGREKEPCLYFIDGGGYINFLPLDGSSCDRLCAAEATDCFYLYGEGILFRKLSDGCIYSCTHTRNLPPAPLKDKNGASVRCTEFCYSAGEIFYKDKKLENPDNKRVYKYAMETKTVETAVEKKTSLFNSAGGRFYYTDALTDSRLFERDAEKPLWEGSPISDFMAFGDCIFFRNKEAGVVTRISADGVNALEIK